MSCHRCFLRSDARYHVKTEYAKKFKERLEFAYWTAEKAARKSADIQKSYYDLKARHSCLKPGDRVLVKNVGLRGKCKIADREVKSEKPHTRKTRIFHRTLLLPFSCIPPRVDRSSPVPVSSGGQTSVPDSQPNVVNPPPPTDVLDSTVEDSEGGYDLVYPSVAKQGMTLPQLTHLVAPVEVVAYMSFLQSGSPDNQDYTYIIGSDIIHHPMSLLSLRTVDGAEHNLNGSIGNLSG